MLFFIVDVSVYVDLRLFQRGCDCHRDTQAAAGGRGGATY